MNSISDLLSLVDAYKLASGVARDSTVSSRVFDDSKKIAALRAGAEINVGRFCAVVFWFQANWPKDVERPEILAWLLSRPETDDQPLKAVG